MVAAPAPDPALSLAAGPRGEAAAERRGRCAVSGVLARGLEEWPQEFRATLEPVTSGVVAHHLLSCLEAQWVVDSSSGWRKGSGEGGVLPHRG